MEKKDDAQRQADLDALPRGGGSLQDQLAAEAAARPPGTVTLEALTTALGTNVTLGPPRQVLAQKQFAIYCAVADSSEGIRVTVCEYPGEAQAMRGETESNVLQSKLAGHQSRVKKKSVLHVVAPSTAPAERVNAVLSTFDSL